MEEAFARFMLVTSVALLLLGLWWLAAFVLMVCWNVGVVSAFPSAPVLSHTQAFCIFIVLMIVGSFFRSSSK